MLVGGENLTTIWFDNKEDNVKIIDQRFLPHKLKIVNLNTLSDSVFAIQSMQVRGAPLIGVTAAYGMYLASKNSNSIEDLEKSAKKLIQTRPTAINLAWSVNKVIDKVRRQNTKNIPQLILQIANKIREEDIDACINIGNNGLKLIENIYEKKNRTINILTHCNAGWLAAVDWGTALSPIFKANKKGIPIHIWVDETRPRNQGFNLTAWELMNENISNTLIVDNVGGHLMQNGMVDMCITGTDRTTINGDVCNKIGTYLKALSAFDNNIPFYVAAPISSIDFKINDGLKNIPIEERNPEEVSFIYGTDENAAIKKICIIPKNAKCINYAFDVTPSKYITKIITEKRNVDANKRSISSLL